MTESNNQKLKCRKCEKVNEVFIFEKVDVSENPELRRRVLDGSINVLNCSECMHVEKFDLSFKYIDPGHKFVLLYIKDQENLEGWVKYETEKAYEREYNESENFLKRPVGISEIEELRNTIIKNEKLDIESEKKMLDELSKKDDFEFYEFVRDNNKLKRHSDLLFYIDRIIVRNKIEDKIQQRLIEDMGEIFKGDDAGKVLANMLGNIVKVKNKYLPDGEKKSGDNSKK